MIPENVKPEDLPVRRGAVAVIMRGDRYLVIRRSALVAAPRLFCFPGGGIEGEETEVEAVVRELQEELGVSFRPLRRVWQCRTRWQIDLAWWHGSLDADVEFLPNPAEVESIHWLSAEEMLASDELLESNRDFLQAIARGEICFPFAEPS